MSVKISIEQASGAPYDPSWIRKRALLLFLLGMEKDSVSDVDQVEETAIEIGMRDLSPMPAGFSDFNVFFRGS